MKIRVISMQISVRHIIKRIFIAAITIWLLVTITFILMHVMPGEPFLGKKALPPDILASINAKYGLDQPIFEQYLHYISNLLQGDLGISLTTRRPVTQIIAQAFPVSFELGIRAMVFVLFFGLLMGVVSAVKKGSVWDAGSTLVSLLGVSIPSFVVGSLLQYFLGSLLYQWTGVQVFSTIGWVGESSKLLPSFALAFGSIATVARLMRSSMLDVLNQPYVHVARAKGLGEINVIRSYCFKNAFMPVLTYLGPLCATIMTGAFAIENIFSIPGLGKYFVTSVQSSDYTVIAGTTVFFGTFLVVANLIVDILYTVLNPSISLTGKGAV